MSLKNLIVIFTSIGILLVGCGGSGTNSTLPESATKEIQSQNSTDLNLQKLIRSASLRFRTENINEAYEFVKKAVNDYGAFITEDKSFNYTQQIGYDLIIKVPSDKFEPLLNVISGSKNIEKLENKSIELKDVTTEFIDIEARLKIKKASQQKLNELLKNAKNLTETLEVQKQMTDLQADIESTEGRLKYLSDQIDYSIINLWFYETPKYSHRFLSDLRDALKGGWQIFLQLVTYISYLWVIILLVFILIFGIRFYSRRKKLKK